MENYHQFRHYRAHGHREQLLHDELQVVTVRTPVRAKRTGEGIEKMNPGNGKKLEQVRG